MSLRDSIVRHIDRRGHRLTWSRSASLLGKGVGVADGYVGQSAAAGRTGWRLQVYQQYLGIARTDVLHPNLRTIGARRSVEASYLP